MKTKQTSDDVNIISEDDRKFASQCNYIQNLVNSEISGDDSVLNQC